MKKKAGCALEEKSKPSFWGGRIDFFLLRLQAGV